jgi:hypothetical protein
MAQGVGPEFKPQYLKKKRAGERGKKLRKGERKGREEKKSVAFLYTKIKFNDKKKGEKQSHS